MAKILNVDLKNSDVTVGMDDGSAVHVSLKEFSFIPQVNSTVEIYKDGDSYVVNQATNALSNNNSNDSNHGGTVVISRVTYVLLAWFLGLFGAHKFYQGNIGIGFAYLAISIIGSFLLFIGPLAVAVFTLLDVIEALKAKSVEGNAPGMMEVKREGFFLKSIK